MYTFHNHKDPGVFTVLNGLIAWLLSSDDEGVCFLRPHSTLVFFRKSCLIFYWNMSLCILYFRLMRFLLVNSPHLSDLLYQSGTGKLLRVCILWGEEHDRPIITIRFEAKGRNVRYQGRNLGKIAKGESSLIGESLWKNFIAKLQWPSKKGTREYTPGLTLFSSCWWLLCQRKENLLVQSIWINIPGYRVHMRGEWNWKGSEKMPVHHSSNTEKQKVPLFQGFCLWQINFSHSYTARFWELSFFSIFFSFIRSLCQYKNANLLPCWPSWGFFFFFFSTLVKWPKPKSTLI